MITPRLHPTRKTTVTDLQVWLRQTGYTLRIDPPGSVWEVWLLRMNGFRYCGRGSTLLSALRAALKETP